MSRLPKNVPTTRLNLQIAETVRRRLEDLRGRSEADSLVEVIRRALVLYEALLDAKDEEASIILRTSDGRERELLIAL